MAEPQVLLQADLVSKTFVQRLDLAAVIARRCGAQVREKVVHAVDGVDLQIHRGEVVGLVGESGCGKSTLGRMVAGLLKPSAGQIRFDGRPLDRSGSAGDRRNALRVQMIFQDPYSSLNPRMKIGAILGEAPRVHGIVSRAELDGYLDALMVRCGIMPEFKDRFPHQFSGGQRQRIGIARALAVKPELIVCDEAVSSLDVSIQAQILNLFMQLRQDLGLTYLFISHDIGVVERLSDRVAVMYLGRIVESGATGELFARPAHPYTSALLAGVPRLDRRRTEYAPVQGEMPSPLDPPSGCHFHPRCPWASARCSECQPALEEVAPGHLAACHLLHPAGGKP